MEGKVKDNKRRKEKENCNKEGENKPDKKRILRHDWNQTNSEVIVTLQTGSPVDSNQVTIDCTDEKCSFQIADGRYWECEFFQPVVADGTSLSYKAGRVIISMVKRDPSMTWSSLEKLPEGAEIQAEEEAPAASENSPEEKPVIEISQVKFNFHEHTSGAFHVMMYVKGIIKEFLDVQFEENSFAVKFSTKNIEFLTNHKATEKTVFVWRVNVKEAIKAEECSTKLTPSRLEIILRKKYNKKWGGLEAAATKGNTTVPTNTWVPVTNRKNADAPAMTTRSTKTALSASKKNCLEDPASKTELDDDVDFPAGDPPVNMTCGKKDFSKKPTCMVSPLAPERQHEQVVMLGHTGLDNLGNTCFMNSVLQCLANTREFRDYFLNGTFKSEINSDNPLGMSGSLAVAFAVLQKFLWSGTSRSYVPSKLKTMISMKAPQFTGFAQHDAQEFMAFLLDGLHEDLNRIHNKPYVETVESDGRPDDVVADEAWEKYKLRNDSIVVDLFQGQYKSKLVCPRCNKVSINFDPFLYLSVPLPKKQRLFACHFFSRDPYTKPVKYILRLSQDAVVEDLKEELYKRTDVHPNCIRVFEVYNRKIHKFYGKGSSLSTVNANDQIFAFEVLNEELAGEPIVQVAVVQRITMPNPVMKCSACGKESLSGEDKLKRCTKCFRAGYCNHTCQKNDWNRHKQVCKFNPEFVGYPFILSLPESQMTFKKLCHLMEAFSRYSVDVFQPPVQLYNSKHSAPLGAVETTTSTKTHAKDNASDSESSSDNTSLYSNYPNNKENLSALSQDEDIPEKVEEESDSSPKEPAVKTKPVTEEPWSVSSPSTMTSSMHAAMTSGSGAQQPVQTRMVFSQPQEGLERGAPMFNICAVDQSGENLPGDDNRLIEDAGGKVLDLARSYYLAMNWNNDEKLGRYVLVQSRDIEFDVEDDSEYGYFESNKITLSQCLKLFTEPEILSPQEAWYCPSCKEHRQATKTLSLWRLPTVLIIQLKRFSFTRLIYRDKIDKMVDFPICGLDVTPYYCGPASSDKMPPLYDLFAVINHHGGMLGGHYTSYARCVDAENTKRSEVGWRLFDDSQVTPISENCIVTNAAYMLFYRRRGVSFNPSVPIVSFSAEASMQKKIKEKENMLDMELNSEPSDVMPAPADSNIVLYEECSQPCCSEMDGVD